MTNLGRLFTLFLVMSVASTAHGQSDDWYVSGGLVFTNDDPDRLIDDALGGAEFALGWNFSDNFTLEGALGYSKIDGFYRQGGSFVRDSETHLDLGANLLAFFDRDRPFAPYVSVGIGYLGVDYNIGGEENRPTGSLGLGFNWRPFQSRWSMRGEYSARLAYEDGNNLVDGIFLLGAQYDFDGPDLFDRSGTTGAPGALTPGAYGPWYASGSIFYFDDDPDRKTDDGLAPGLQFNVGYDWTDHLTVEGQLGYAEIDGFYRRNGVFVRDSETHLDISANVLAFYDRDRAFAPYVMAGIGYLGVSENGGGDENRPSATLGAGYKWRVGQSRFSIRNELRARLAYEEDFNLVDYIFSVGVEYRFGGPRQRDDLPRDSDGDGVLDMWDECPDTPPGVAVTSRGCEIKRMDRDEDNDRVFDDRDQCPGTPEGMPVDPFGCSLDSDRDGVTTDNDRCPGSRPGARVDEFGCENDTDGDGVPDHLDRCPGTRPNAKRIDQFGCEVRDVINLPGVNFQSGSDLLLAGAERLIQDLAATLIENDYLQIEVAGHTDDQGSAENNQGLSDRRAKTVYDYLIRYGVDPNRLSYRGYGESQPIADNTTADGRATNRRVELRVVRND